MVVPGRETLHNVDEQSARPLSSSRKYSFGKAAAGFYNVQRVP